MVLIIVDELDATGSESTRRFQTLVAGNNVQSGGALEPVMARCRKAAICPRVTRPSGQYADGRQPCVIPAQATRLIEPWWMDRSSSPNQSTLEASRSKARARNVAICARVTRPDGQYRAGSQPVVMPAVASRLMAASCTEPSSSVKWSAPVAGK